MVGVFALITFAGLFRVLVQDGRFWFGDGFGLADGLCFVGDFG